MITLREALLGGPGLNGYAYCSDVYCVDCGQAQIRDIAMQAPALLDSSDSDDLPVPIFFGESDHAQHCGECGEYLYGKDAENESSDR